RSIRTNFILSQPGSDAKIWAAPNPAPLPPASAKVSPENRLRTHLKGSGRSVFRLGPGDGRPAPGHRGLHKLKGRFFRPLSAASIGDDVDQLFGNHDHLSHRFAGQEAFDAFL